MPNFVIEYSHSVTQQLDPQELMDRVFAGARASGHFPPEAIKLRMEARGQFRMHGDQRNFIHVSAHILSGRTDAEKLEISSTVLESLRDMAITSTFVSVEVVDIHRPSFVDLVF